MRFVASRLSICVFGFTLSLASHAAAKTYIQTSCWTNVAEVATSALVEKIKNLNSDENSTEITLLSMELSGLLEAATRKVAYFLVFNVTDLSTGMNTQYKSRVVVDADKLIDDGLIDLAWYRNLTLDKCSSLDYHVWYVEPV